MANVQLTFGQVVTHNVFSGASVRSETVVSSAASALGSIVANRHDRLKVFCATAVYVSDLTVATAATAVYVAAGVTEYMAVREGARISVIDAP